MRAHSISPNSNNVTRSFFEWHIHIGLDLDETLASTMPGFLNIAHDQGKLLNIATIEDIHCYDISLIDPTMSKEDGQNLWSLYGKSTMDPFRVPIVAWARAWVDNLRCLGKKISIITARSDQEIWKKERTYSWIRAYFEDIGEDEVYFVNHFSDESRPKSHTCKTYGVTLMIEDSMENAYDLVENGIHCILLEKPWNRDRAFEHPFLTRVKDWGEIRELMER